MDVTFTVPSKVVNKVVGEYVQENLYDAYSKTILKAAGVPAKKTLVTQLLAEPKFAKALEKEFNVFFKYWCETELGEYTREVDLKLDLIDACEKIQESEDEEWFAEQRQASESQKMLDVILHLERAGYIVTKKG